MAKYLLAILLFSAFLYAEIACQKCFQRELACFFLLARFSISGWKVSPFTITLVRCSHIKRHFFGTTPSLFDHASCRQTADWTAARRVIWFCVIKSRPPRAHWPITHGEPSVRRLAERVLIKTAESSLALVLQIGWCSLKLQHGTIGVSLIPPHSQNRFPFLCVCLSRSRTEEARKRGRIF